jgi:inner membrane protein
MMSKTHVAIGVAYGTALIPAVQRGEFTLEQFGLIMIGLVIGSLLPDLDHPQSVISRQIPIIGGVISGLTRHRGLLHSILGVILFYFVCAALMFPMATITQNTRDLASLPAGLMLGYIFHIGADMLTKSGVKLFYPLKWNIGFGVFTTGGILEFGLRLVLMGWIVLQVIQLFI